MSCKYSEFNFKNQCYSCPPGCRKCSNEGICLECYSNNLEIFNSNCKQNFKNRCTLENLNKLNITQGFLDINGGCESCHSSCSSCFGSGINECISCDQRNVLDGTTCIQKGAEQPCGNGRVVNLNNQCDPCPNNCLKCSLKSDLEILNGFKYTEYSCDICDTGYFLDKGKCVKSCPSGESFEEGKCILKPAEQSLFLCTQNTNLCSTNSTTRDLEQGILIAMLVVVLVVLGVIGIVLLRNHRVLGRKYRTLKINQMMPRPDDIGLLHNRSFSKQDRTQIVPIQQLKSVIPANRAKCYNVLP